MIKENSFRTNVSTFNTETGDKIIYPFGPPIFQTEVDENFTNEILEEGRKLNIQDDDWNPKLAGNLKYGRSYHFKEDYQNKVEKYLLHYVERFFNGLYEMYGPNIKMINTLMSVKNHNSSLFKATSQSRYQPGVMKLASLWINFSQRYDFNPPHTHDGDLSFVLFCDVPHEIFEVQADSNTQRAGQLHFSYGEPITPLMGNEYPVKPYKNLLMIFPAELKHYVPSYWVDKERVSVSGNFVVRPREGDK